MSFLAFFGRLADSDWSVALHESQYAYSIIESIHVWTLAVFFGSILMVDLRLLGLTMRKVPVSEVRGAAIPVPLVPWVGTLHATRTRKRALFRQRV